MTTKPREVFCLNGEHFVFASDHPLEERIVVLTEKDAAGNWIIPPAKEWDGVESSPGLLLRAPKVTVH